MSQGRRILLADDDEQVQRTVKRLAEQLGHEIVQARTGAEVRKLVLDTRPELVVLDIGFPDADGRDILAQLKADPKTEAIPVLVWSALDPDSNRETTLSLGAEDYVEKADAQGLLAKIKRVMLRVESERCLPPAQGIQCSAPPTRAAYPQAGLR